MKNLEKARKYLAAREFPAAAKVLAEEPEKERPAEWCDLTRDLYLGSGDQYEAAGDFTNAGKAWEAGTKYFHMKHCLSSWSSQAIAWAALSFQMVLPFYMLGLIHQYYMGV